MRTVRLATQQRVLKPAPVFLYGLTVLVSSCLVFWVQPLAVRGLLPVMGGAPLVWNTAMLFFQGTLLLGYLLAHVLARRFAACRPTRGARLPVGRGAALRVDRRLRASIRRHAAAGGRRAAGPVATRSPRGNLRSGLPGGVDAVSACIGVAVARSRDTVDPYVLYSVSNAGSIGVLLLYPFVLEPLLGVGWQLWMWHAGPSPVSSWWWSC